MWTKVLFGNCISKPIKTYLAWPLQIKLPFWEPTTDFYNNSGFIQNFPLPNSGATNHFTLGWNYSISIKKKKIQILHTKLFLCTLLLLVKFYLHIYLHILIITFNQSIFFFTEKTRKPIIMKCLPHSRFCNRLANLMNIHLTTFSDGTCSLYCNFSKWQKWTFIDRPKYI